MQIEQNSVNPFHIVIHRIAADWALLYSKVKGPASHWHMQNSAAKHAKISSRTSRDAVKYSVMQCNSYIDQNKQHGVELLKLVKFVYILIMHDHEWMYQLWECEMRKGESLSQFVLYRYYSTNVASRTWYRQGNKLYRMWPRCSITENKRQMRLKLLYYDW